MENLDLGEIVSPLLTWYNENARELPWRIDTDAYHVWVSEIMLQQTRIDTVIEYYKRFIEKFPTVEALAQAKRDELFKTWEGLGYYSRVTNMQKAAIKICDEFQGRFPSDYQDILSLPGIGEYTAGAISSIAFNKPCAAVDGNVLRIFTRLTKDAHDIQDCKFKRQTAQRLSAVYPQGECRNFTQSLMELGEVICVPNGAPGCMTDAKDGIRDGRLGACPLSHLCMAYRTGVQMQYPVKRKKAERRIEDKTVLLLIWDNRIALHQRADGGLLGGMWEFPNLEGKKSERDITDWLEAQGISVHSVKKEHSKKHIFTHIEWHMQIYTVTCSLSLKRSETTFEWVTKEQLEREYALPTAFKKVYG